MSLRSDLRRSLLLAVACALPGIAFAQDGAHGAGGHDDPHAHHRAAMGEASAADAPRRVDGLAIPDVAVRDQEGVERRFYSDLVAGKTVAMNFVFTTCTTICPPMGATFGRLQRQLGPRAGRDVHLISVSVDPVTDTPARLRAWGETFGTPGDGWTLVTGTRVEITRLLKALEVFTADVTEHSPVVLIGDEPTGRWTRAYGLASPAKLAGILDASGAETAPEEGP